MHLRNPRSATQTEALQEIKETKRALAYLWDQHLVPCLPLHYHCPPRGDWRKGTKSIGLQRQLPVDTQAIRVKQQLLFSASLSLLQDGSLKALIIIQQINLDSDIHCSSVYYIHLPFPPREEATAVFLYHLKKQEEKKIILSLHTGQSFPGVSIGLKGFSLDALNAIWSIQGSKQSQWELQVLNGA